MPCESPCKECSTSGSSCTECDGTNGLEFLFGPTCLTECPAGTRLDTVKKHCLGCKAGCLTCDPYDPGICTVCEPPLLELEGGCTAACPVGYIENPEATWCINISSMNANFVYFPMSMLTVILLITSYVGRCVKHRHKVLANFIILESFLEHVSIIIQVVLAFTYASVLWGCLSLTIWLVYVLQQCFF